MGNRRHRRLMTTVADNLRNNRKLRSATLAGPTLRVGGADDELQEVIGNRPLPEINSKSAEIS
ncbi:MAG: hypothetical protein A4E66_01791 [Syntrophus sp. PtaB.Bin001]|nr:MAG: hypothetical protein A4E66_01791 [Syntrophus sp. PtaB.Bin001]